MKLLLIVVLGLVFASRLPFLGNTLIGEEGSFAFMAVDDGHPIGKTLNEVAVISRLRGELIPIAPEHPILPYLLLKNVWRPLWKAPPGQAGEMEEMSRRARLPFFFLFLRSALHSEPTPPDWAELPPEEPPLA